MQTARRIKGVRAERRAEPYRKREERYPAICCGVQKGQWVDRQQSSKVSRLAAARRQKKNARDECQLRRARGPHLKRKQMLRPEKGFEKEANEHPPMRGHRSAIGSLSSG